VAELIEALQLIEDKSLPVVSAGCDCYGEVAKVVVSDRDVSLERRD
jgi:hypothetical protein